MLHLGYESMKEKQEQSITKFVLGRDDLCRSPDRI